MATPKTNAPTIINTKMTYDRVTVEEEEEEEDNGEVVEYDAALLE